MSLCNVCKLVGDRYCPTDASAKSVLSPKAAGAERPLFDSSNHVWDRVLPGIANLPKGQNLTRVDSDAAVPSGMEKRG